MKQTRYLRGSVTAVGMLILICDVSVGAKYFACFLAVTGASSAAPSAITWISKFSYEVSFVSQLILTCLFRFEVRAYFKERMIRS